MPARRGCSCKKKEEKKDRIMGEMAKTSILQTFDRIEWLKKHVSADRLMDRTVRIKYLKHLSEMREYFSTKRVFRRFDDNNDKHLEADEVNMKFKQFHLRLDVDSLKKLFKKTAINRKKSDPCTELTLYEFLVFSKSKKADLQFEKLMKEVKHNTVSLPRPIRRNSLGLPVQNSGVMKIMPTRDAKYVNLLPTSFNDLMNHFKDEEERNEKRKDVIDKIQSLATTTEKDKSYSLVESNTKNLKMLIQSHFPDYGVDEQQRKMVTQNKHATEAQRAIQEKVKEQVARQRMSILIPQSRFSLSGKMSAHSRIAPNSGFLSCRSEMSDLMESARQAGRAEALSEIATMENPALLSLKNKHYNKKPDSGQSYRPTTSGRPKTTAYNRWAMKNLKSSLVIRKDASNPLIVKHIPSNSFNNSWLFKSAATLPNNNKLQKSSFSRGIRTAQTKTKSFFRTQASTIPPF